MTPQVKVCGVTDAVFATAAAQRGVDYLGVIFAARSPRCVMQAQAQEIAQAARAARPAKPPKIVGVFVEQTAPEIAALAAAVPLDVVQLHGAYDASDVATLKAKGLEVWRLSEDAADAGLGEDVVLLDGRVGQHSGRTGARADWRRVAELKRKGCRVALAGGISAANAAEAAATGADILDANSSLETAPGVKSLARLDDFLNALFRPPRFYAIINAMEMKVFNSLTRRVEPLTPLADNTIRLYTCGPTVYNFAHIGNFRAYAFEDVLRRVVQFNGLKIRQVMNLTDVDDKTIRGANAAGVPLTDYTKTYKDAFFADLKKLNIQPAEVYPAATDHIPEMIDLVSKLMAKGIAYKSEDGSVYFAVRKFPGYGKLAHIDFDHQQTGARCAADEYDKENVGDFALWKAWEDSDGPVGWDSPWGRGRPGWHIECSAMSMKYLGETFDLHTGGIDNLFPHHENEIAQAEAATGKEFVRTWMHCAHLRVNGEKMSKSAGNFFTLRDLLEKGYAGREIRYVLVNAHYRQGLNFAFSALDDARKSLERIDRCVDALQQKAGPNALAGETPEFAAQALESFAAAVNDDLNTPKAFAALFELVREANGALATLTPPQAAAVLEVFRKMDTVLGVIFFGKAVAIEVPAEIQALLDKRAAARQAKDWAESDRLRDEIAAAGWSVKDSRDGQTVTRK